MATKVYVDANFNPVKGPDQASWVFNSDDDRLKKAQAAAKARGSAPAPAAPRPADEDGSVEHVERPKK